MAHAFPSAAHADAYQTLVKGLLDPAQMPAAKNHPLLKPILDKLSDDDVKTLSNFAQAANSQEGSPHDS